MSALASLAGRLTLPYRRGAEYVAVPLGADGGGATAFGAYDFADYRARWGQDPESAAYAIAPLTDVSADDDLVLTIAYTFNGPKTTTLTIPRGTLAGTGFVIPLADGAGAALRLLSLTVTPAVPGAGKDAWHVVALLGTIAKLAWLFGAEKDMLARARFDVRAQRFVDSAFGGGLDAIGRDLRVPRFPPRPYSYDGDTIALWHLDDGLTAGTVVDERKRFKQPDHPGTLVNAAPVRNGKYGGAYAFLTNASAIVVKSSPDFDLPLNRDATIEAFVKAAAPADATPRAIVVRRASETAAGSNVVGWSLCVVNARGITGNAMFAMCDGATEVRCFADVSVTDGKYHHVAAIVDRGRKRARIIVDGTYRASAAIAGLGAVAPPDHVRFGSSAAGNQLSGAIDEVRISGVARATFHPALGEDDDAYRARLRIFRRWVLPAPQRVIDLVNEAAPLAGDPAPYVLVEANRLTIVAERAVRIVPAALAAGTAIATDGTVPPDESVAGTPADDAGFDPALDLVTYANAGVDASGVPGGARMQAQTARVLDALAARLAALGTPGKIVLERSYDPAGPTPLHAVGRALRLRHQTLGVDALGALAHRAGFAYVRNLGPDLAVAVPAGERLAIRGAPATAPHVDAGSAFDLSVDPAQRAGGTYAWTVVTPGPAQAHLVAHSADAALKTPIASRARVRLVTDAPGELQVRVEHSYRGRTRSGTLTLRVDPVKLLDGHALDALGNADPDPGPMAGAPDPNFDPAFLIKHAPNPAIDFGADPKHLQMQVGARDALDALSDLLVARGTPGRLKVLAAFDPLGAGVEKVGRRLLLGHQTLGADVLGALASRFFDYVARTGSTITAVVRPGPWIELGDAVNGTPLGDEIIAGIPLHIAGAPAAPAGGTFNWSTRRIGNGTGSFDTLVRADTTFTPAHTGTLVLALTYVAKDDTRAAPYTFEVRLKPALDVPATIVPKPQYDIIMNVLDAYHPIGVEVRTDRLRPHVVEIEQDPAKAFPAYSFPDFRM